jgi:hypothetical protein
MEKNTNSPGYEDVHLKDDDSGNIQDYHRHRIISSTNYIHEIT